MAAAATGVHLGALVARRLLHRAPFPHSWTSAAAAAAWAARKCRRLHAAVAASSSHEEAPRPHVCGQPRLEPDWTVAAAMAGASFEAYGGLQEQGLAEQHRGGTSLHYLDARYLRTTMAGLLQVRPSGSKGAAAALVHPSMHSPTAAAL